MPRKHTALQEAFVATKLKNPNMPDTVAAREAGYSANTAHNVTRDVLTQPGTMALMEEFGIAAREKLHDQFILNSIESMMLADKIDHSHTEPDRVVPDWEARDKGLKHAFVARNLNQQPGGNTNVQVNFGGLKDQYSKDK